MKFIFLLVIICCTSVMSYTQNCDIVELAIDALTNDTSVNVFLKKELVELYGKRKVKKRDRGKFIQLNIASKYLLTMKEYYYLRRNRDTLSIVEYDSLYKRFRLENDKKSECLAFKRQQSIKSNPFFNVYSSWVLYIYEPTAGSRNITAMISYEPNGNEYLKYRYEPSFSTFHKLNLSFNSEGKLENIYISTQVW